MAFNLADFPEACERPFRITTHSAWHAHMPLAPILVKLLRPGIFVELGTHAGDSYLAFCQAVKRLAAATRCAAVDTWKGDAHTGAYGPEILAELRAAHDPNFGTFSRLVPSTFDVAARTFAEGSIDLLHIDGAHTYEAVRHDYETWRPKLSARGVVLFHDTTERYGDFGVWRFWAEVARDKPGVNLPYGHGLGILAVGTEQPPAFLEFLLELNTRPGLVRLLQTLGEHVQLLMDEGIAVRSLFQCQAFVNEWRQRTGQPIRFPTANPEAAWANPEALGKGAIQDVHQLAVDALNLAAEVMRLRGGKV